MSIDAIVVGLRKLKVEREIKITLEKRPGGDSAGQSTLIILNTPQLEESADEWLSTLEKLIDQNIWGDSSKIMLGERLLARRTGYTGINLVDNWEDVVSRGTSKKK